MRFVLKVLDSTGRMLGGHWGFKLYWGGGWESPGGHQAVTGRVVDRTRDHWGARKPWWGIYTIVGGIGFVLQGSRQSWRILGGTEML